MISIAGKEVVLEKLLVVDFTSYRKRMSVVVRFPKDKSIYLFTKGADDVMMTRLCGDSDTVVTEKALEKFASSGLRTLVVAYKKLSEAEYQSWLAGYHKASIALLNREVN